MHPSVFAQRLSLSITALSATLLLNSYNECFLFIKTCNDVLHRCNLFWYFLRSFAFLSKTFWDHFVSMSTAAVIIKLFSELKQIAQQKRYKAITGSCNKQISMSLSLEQAFSMLIPFHTLCSLHENTGKSGDVLYVILSIFFTFYYLHFLILTTAVGRNLYSHYSQMSLKQNIHL